MHPWISHLMRVALATGALCWTGIACAQSSGAADVASPASGTAAAPAQQLTIATWGGAYAEALKAAVFQPFSVKNGIRLVVERHVAPGRDGDRLRAAGEAPPDVLDLSSSTLADACAEGLLEPIDVNALQPAPGAASAETDFLPGAISPCGVGSLAWSAVFVVDKSQFKGSAPATIADVFDVVRFPGKRTLPRSPRFLLELALMADSVPPEEVYLVLDTDQGVAHALENLRRLTTDVVWWDQGSDAVRAILDRQAAVGLAFNGRIFLELAKSPSYAIIWDGQIYDVNSWAIAKSSQHKAAALEFVRFATATDQLAATVRQFPYGPLRSSALAQVGHGAASDTALADSLPTSPRNMQRALRFDAAWWARNERRIVERFEGWLREIGRKPG